MKKIQMTQMQRSTERFMVLCCLYFVSCFGGSLRGSEGLMIKRSALIGEIDKGRIDKDILHVVVPLLGRFKGETGERCYLLLLANTTDSGIQMRKWVERAAVMVKAREP